MSAGKVDLGILRTRAEERHREHPDRQCHAKRGTSSPNQRRHRLLE
jgi:hypothetical protein